MPSTPPGLRALWISASQASSFPLLTMPCISREARCRSEEHTSELHHDQISYAVFCLKKKKNKTRYHNYWSGQTDDPIAQRGADQRLPYRHQNIASRHRTGLRKRYTVSLLRRAISSFPC